MRKRNLLFVLLLALLPFVGWAQENYYAGQHAQHVNIKQTNGDSIQYDLRYNYAGFKPEVRDGKIVWSVKKYVDKDGDNVIDMYDPEEAFSIDNVTSIDFLGYKADSIEVRKALIEFYHAMDGDNWFHNDNWCSDKPIWEWYGVNRSCEYNNDNKAVPFVIELNLIDNNLSGEIPEGCLTRMGPMDELFLGANNIKGTYPYEVNKIYTLEKIALPNNQFSGPLSLESTLAMPNLYDISLSGNYFEGSLPNGEAVRAFMRRLSPLSFAVEKNLFKGEVPDAIIKDPYFSSTWAYILPQREAGLNISGIDIPAPVFHNQYMDGTPANSDEIYSQNKYTLVYEWAWWCQHSEALNKRLIPVYLAYKDKGFEVIGIHRQETDKLPEYLRKNPVPWKNIDFDTWRSRVGGTMVYDSNESAVFDFFESFMKSPILFLVDQKGHVVFSTVMDEKGMTPQDDRKWKVFDVLEEALGPVEFYTSTDYTKDGEVTTLQTATTGQGVDLVFVGEGFTDKDLEGDRFDQLMDDALEQFFAYEPYTSLQDRFNVYAVKAVSPNSAFLEGSTHAIDTNPSKALAYASKVPNLIEGRPMHVVVIYNNNSGGSDGRSYCTMYEDNSFVCYAMDGVTTVLNHEAGGHGFGKLLDEYVESGNENLSLPDENKNEMENKWTSLGWGANVDWRSNPAEVKWAKFISDERYADEQIGVYEGGYLYQYGAYRPTENSMMRNNNIGFNAPSREEIYKRVMKESEGDSWTYDYETFVAFDDAGHNQFVNALSSSAKVRKAPSQNDQINEDSMEQRTAPPVFLKGSWRDYLKADKK